jgi:hypothetical protein
MESEVQTVVNALCSAYYLRKRIPLYFYARHSGCCPYCAARLCRANPACFECVPAAWFAAELVLRQRASEDGLVVPEPATSVWPECMLAEGLKFDLFFSPHTGIHSWTLQCLLGCFCNGHWY